MTDLQSSDMRHIR